MQNPLDAAQGLVHAGEGPHGFGVDEDGARAFPAQLHEERALTVAEAGGALGVHGHRPGGDRELLGGPGEATGGVDNARQTVRGSVEMHGRWNVEVLEAGHHDLGRSRFAGG